MTLTHDRRRELIAILSLAVGVFLGLALIPTPLTGPIGGAVGRALRLSLGLGATLIPVALIVVGLANFGWLRGLEIRRAGILCAGLAVLVPYGVALGIGLDTVAELDPSYDQWSTRYKLVGMLPAFLAIGVTGLVGTVGGVLAGVLALSVLTILTIGWHPFRRFARSGDAVPQFAAAPDGGVELAPVPAPARPRAPARRRPSVPPPSGREEPNEQAFITEAAIEPFPLDLLDQPDADTALEDQAELDRLGDVLIDTLKTFKVNANLGAHRSTGPVVTQFEVSPAPGVKVGRIAALADDLALKMEAQSIRIVAPIPGKAYVGVEVPNPTARIVRLREMLSPPHWNRARPGLPLALGKDLEGRPVMADLAKMPHLLIAGATGSGKSVCINTIITSLIHRYTDRELKMIMIDPKMVELTVYNALPHLKHPVVTNNKHAAEALKWAMRHMEHRYALFSVNNVRNLHEFNRKVKEGRDVMIPRALARLRSFGGNPEVPDDDPDADPSALVPYEETTLPYVVVIVDELADLMMTVQGEVEKPLAILAQKARATGIHLILATQRPSVNVITGLIKANFPSRIAFRVASKVDSRTILDQNGAEALLGNGDMLFLPPGKSEPVRLQGAFIDTEETERITTWYREERELRDAKMGEDAFGPEQQDILAENRDLEALEQETVGEGGGDAAGADRDPLFRESAETCIQNQGGSTSLLQRKLRIGYGRAARIIDQLHAAGILGPPDGSKPREVLIGAEQLDEYCGP